MKYNQLHQMELPFDGGPSYVHRRENNAESQRHLDANRESYNNQCLQVLALLQQGVRLTSRDALVHYGIGHLPRRILDLKEKGWPIKSKFVVGPDGRTRFKEYFL